MPRGILKSSHLNDFINPLMPNISEPGHVQSLIYLIFAIRDTVKVFENQDGRE